METIRLNNVSFAYPLSEGEALKNVSFTINSSEFIVLCGKSGCGKSTLLRHLKKNMIPYGRLDGEILYCGEAVEDLEDRRSASEIGFVLQNPDNQIVTDKVWHELAFGLESLGFENRAIKRRVAEMASYFGIQSWFRKNVSELSGGQKQLLNLASIMAMQPKLLILDEPTSQLDPIAASDFLTTIHKINRDLGTTVIISEHRLEEVFPMADKVMVMDKGRIIAFDTPKKIGNFLNTADNGQRHPMFYGLPSVMRIFSGTGDMEESPLTIREGRILLESKLETVPQDKLTINKEEQPAKENNPAITLKNLWFRYSRDGDDILRGLNLTVKRGEWFCLLGGNGVGKSTTLKAICDMVKPQRGTIKVTDVKALLPQNPQAIFTEITCEEELVEALHHDSLSDEEKVRRVEEMLDLMEITHLRKSNPYDLSGGEQQRLALGKILLTQPKILLLDEPTKGLDPFFKRTLAGILRKLVTDGVTIFMVSHDIEFCAEYSDRCSMFFDGDVVSMGTPKEFFAGNSFYTTTANKLVREWKPELITCEEVASWLRDMI